jgi:iron complex outermembrane receptor protein
MALRNRISVVSLLALGSAIPAFAQEAPATAPVAANQQNSRDVVIITANKREESVQDVAVAVTAISADQKDKLGIITMEDLTNVTPGMSYSNERVTVRGVGKQTGSFGADPGVANYNDGIYTAFALFAGKDPILIDRVEILRGPQGTLYGRNAIGGAVNTISKRPTDDLKIDLSLSAGNYDAAKVAMAISGPITDSLRYRIAGVREVREGTDINYGNNGETEGWEIDDKHLEFQLEGDIGDRFDWWFKTVEYAYDKAGPPGGRSATFSTAPFLTSNVFTTSSSVNPIASWAFSGNPSIVSFEQIGDRRDNPFATNGERAYNVNIPTVARLPQYDEYILEGVYHFDDFDVKYTGGYTYYDYRLVQDIDGTSVNAITYQAIAPSSAACNSLVGQPITANAACAAAGSATRTISTNLDNEYKESRAFFSNEVNLISTWDSPFQWLLGLYQFQENNDQAGTQLRLRDEPGVMGRYQTDAGGLFPAKDALYSSRNSSLQNSYGLYGRVDWEVTDQWKFSGGLRYSYDLKDIAEEGFATCFIVCRAFASAIPGGLTSFTQDYVATTPLAFSGAGVTYDPDTTARRRLKNEWSMVTGDIGAEYRPMDDMLLFLKYSKGYKAGAINTGFSPSMYADAEKVYVTEGGWKQEWKAYDLTTNLAVFHYQYEDMQAAVTQVLNQGVAGQERNVAVLTNIPEATSKGIELESRWSPIDDLNIAFTYSYIAAEITDGGGVFIDATRDVRCLPAVGTTPVACGAAGAAVPQAYVDPLSRIRLEGNELPQSPRNKVAINATYMFRLDDGSTLLPAVSYYWRDGYYETIVNSSTELAPAQEQTDARLTWSSPGNQWAVIGFVRNLFDQEQTRRVLSQPFRVADNGRYQTFDYTPPRTWGVELQFHW